MNGKKGPNPLVVVLSAEFKSENGRVRRHWREVVEVVFKPRVYAHEVFATRFLKRD